MKATKNALSLAISLTIPLSIPLSASATPVLGDEEPLAREIDGEKLEEVVVLGSGETFNSSAITEAMTRQQSSITSVNALIDNLPGVSINEGDTYGFDDWSTNITVRGFTTSLDQQQVGTTIDGIPNGGSAYGGGSKANRYVDPANVAGVEVSQGTADIGSRSNEALGGTIDYRTDDPRNEPRTRTEVSLGEFDAQRLYLRQDTGTFAENMKAWISYSNQKATDWISESADNEREHIAAKLVREMESGTVKAYVSYDDIQENNYQRVYSATQFKQNPNDDGLSGDWTGIPVIDQNYRQVWGTLRENLLAYAQFDFDITDTLNVKGGYYYHSNEGRGDWAPPYLMDVTDDGDSGHSEFLGGSTATLDRSLGQIYYVDADGRTLTPAENCQSAFGDDNSVYDPSCYEAGAIPAMSYRHTHYEKERSGFTFDFTHQSEVAGLPNELRGGFWYEDATRDEHRDWHRVTDASTGPAFASTPYWTQYDRSYPQQTQKWYLQDALTINSLTLSLGVKQFLVDVEREDLFHETQDISADSDSDPLLSAGLVWETPLQGTEIFAGYAENFKAVSDAVLEPKSNANDIEPETSETSELGLRYSGDALSATATLFRNDFENRLYFLDNSSADEIDYAGETNGVYFNAGGIESSGLELLLDYRINEQLSLYSSYTWNDASYLGTGDKSLDSNLGLVPGNDVIGIAEQMLVAGLDWTGERFYGGLSAKFTDDRYVDMDNTWTAESYVLADAYLGLNLAGAGGYLSSLNLKLLVNNLFDESYLGTVVTNGAWIGAPRTASLSATFDF